MPRRRSPPSRRSSTDAAAAAAPLSPPGRALHDRFVAAIDDDLDLPTALAVVRETLRADLPADERRWLVLDADLVLGLDLDLAWASPSTGRRPGRPARRRGGAARRAGRGRAGRATGHAPTRSATSWRRWASR